MIFTYVAIAIATSFVGAAVAIGTALYVAIIVKRKRIR